MYSYVGNKPTVFVDPLGLAWQLVIVWRDVFGTGNYHGDLMLVDDGKGTSGPATSNPFPPDQVPNSDAHASGWGGVRTGLSMEVAKRGRKSYTECPKQVVDTGNMTYDQVAKQLENARRHVQNMTWTPYEFPNPFDWSAPIINSNTLLNELIRSTGFTPPQPIVPAPGYNPNPRPPSAI